MQNPTSRVMDSAWDDRCRPRTGPFATPVVRIGVVPVRAIRLAALLQAFDEVIVQRKPGYACFCEARLCVCAARDSRVRQTLEEAMFCLPDGVATTWGARLLGERLPERLTGPSVMLEVCQYGVARGYRHFFYGGAAGIPERLAEKLCERFPGLQVAGTYSPPFRKLTPQEDREVVEMINRCDPDIVWVGLGAPKQELWTRDHLGRLSAPLLLPVGAAFDFHSGNKKRAPLWIRNLGFEWLYRMLMEDKQTFLRYVRNQPVFAAMILKQAALRGLRRNGAAGKEGE